MEFAYSIAYGIKINISINIDTTPGAAGSLSAHVILDRGVSNGALTILPVRCIAHLYNLFEDTCVRRTALLC